MDKKQKVVGFLDRHTRKLVDINHQKFRLPSKAIIWMVLFISYNVLFQGLADVVIKVLGYTPLYRGFPLRIDFLFLTAVSVLMGYQALIGMRRREIDVTRNSISIGLLVETGLIISDLHHVWLFGSEYAGLTVVRSFFVVLTLVNLMMLLYIARKLKIYRDDKGRFKLV